MKKIVIFGIILLVCFFMTNMVIQAKEQKEVRKPVVITFCDIKSSDCKELKEVMQEMEQKYSATVDFVDINTNSDDFDYINLQKKYNVTQVPTVIYLNYNKGLTKKVIGAYPMELIQRDIKQILK